MAAVRLSADLRAMVRPARELTAPGERAGAHRSLPSRTDLRDLLPDQGLRRGTVSAVAAGPGYAPGGTSLLLALLAEPSRAGSWCAVVGLPGLGLAAAAEYGVVLDRLALVPQPGPMWREVVGALLDGFDIVVVADFAPAPRERQQLAARARQRGAVLVPFGPRPWGRTAI